MADVGLITAAIYTAVWGFLFGFTWLCLRGIRRQRDDYAAQLDAAHDEIAAIHAVLEGVGIKVELHDKPPDEAELEALREELEERQRLGHPTVHLPPDQLH